MAARGYARRSRGDGDVSPLERHDPPRLSGRAGTADACLGGGPPHVSGPDGLV